MKYEIPKEPSYLKLPHARIYRLKTARKELGWTQREMAEALEMSPNFISMMERGDQPITRRTDLAVRYLASLPYKAMSREERITNERAWATIEDCLDG